MREELFSTDLKRLTEVLAINLYDDPFVPVRELLQNANDACLIRQGFSAFEGSRITIHTNMRERIIEISDNGCGITQSELTNVLSRIASSNKLEKRKKLLDLGFDDARGIAGKFGLGMLSCFIIAKKVEIVTHSMERNSPTLFWYSSGDGKYYWETVNEPFEIGTKVKLHLKDDDYLRSLLDKIKLREVIDKYCRFLRVPIYFSDSSLQLNSSALPWQQNCPDDEIESFVQSHFNCTTLYHFHIDFKGDVNLSSGHFEGAIAEDVSLQARVFIPGSRYSGASGVSDVYASGIYVGRLRNLLPDWFKFGAAVLESQSLDLTLGRDNVVQDKWSAAVKQILSESITSHIFSNLRDRASSLRSRFNAIFKVHEQEIKDQARGNYDHGDKRFFGAVKDVIPFNFRGNLMSIPEFAQITPSQGITEGKRVIYYFATGFGERGSGLQERLLFDTAEIPYFYAANYYDRNFLEVYNRASVEYRLMPIQKGLEYILKFDDIEDEIKQIVEGAYAQLSVRARASRFNPTDIPAVITAVSEKKRDGDFDVSTEEGREKMLEALVKKEINIVFDSGYTLCVNLANPMLQDLIERIKRDGLQPAFRMALRLIYNNAVTLFGEHSNREMANVVSTGSLLIQSYLRSLADADLERVRFRKLLTEKEMEMSAIETENQTLVEKISEKVNQDTQKMLAESNKVFLSYSYRPEDEALSNGLAELLINKGFVVIKGKSDSLGSIKDTIVRQIRECRYFVAVMTKRQPVDETKYTTSSWFLEEKGVAIGAERTIVLMIEDGIGDEFFGKLQGDIQRFHFNRSTTFMSKSLEVASLMIKDREEYLTEINKNY